MEHYAGIDVSLEESSVCVVDAKGNVLHEAKVKTEVEALGAWLKKWGVSYERVGLEAGPMSPWLFEGLSHLKLPAMCIETRRMKAFTSASPVKTDRKDARAIADAMRMGFFKMVHVKSRASLEARVLLTNRTLLVHQRIQQQNTIRGTLKTFGLKLGKVSQGGSWPGCASWLRVRPASRRLSSRC